jgi:hypothetical protein
MNGYTGGISLTVLDPLIANGEASSSIPILVEVAAMDDFEFACPCPPSVTAALGNSNLAIYTQSGTSFRFPRLNASEGDVTIGPRPDVPSEDPGPLLPQSGLGVNNDRRVEEYTTGETIKSLKQLLMIPTSVIFDVADSQESLTSLPFFAYYPRLASAVPMADTTSAFLTSSRAGLIASCYAYWHGTTSYDVYADREATASMIQIRQCPTDGNFPGQIAPSLYSGGSGTASLRVTTGMNAVHVQSPCYTWFPRVSWRSMYNFSPSSRNFSPGSNSLWSNVGYGIPVMAVRNTTGKTVRVNLSISGGEDARVGVFIGPPPIYLFSPTRTAPVESSPQVV